MKTGHPRANFGPPAPANTRTRRYGSGIPVDTGVGSRHSRGFANRDRFILRVTNTTYNTISYTSLKFTSLSSGKSVASLISLLLTKPSLLHAPRQRSARVDSTESRFRT